ncbi:MULTISPECIES: winged helix-turn-helix domain-containing protein [unclassified Roseitalea]|uniref:winged helix-turn-helix domain-containing protein n=1 Tax=unclassified Roseitalea TaxID=2639107 RepID=UPI00273D93AE|nr:MULTISPECIES: winged helix-turn-helix domain-containing protein [unclassified Roseitalea]
MIENRDRDVSRGDLVESVWGGRIVSEAAIAGGISAARRAVGDSGSQQKVIKTVARRGFRLSPKWTAPTMPIGAGTLLVTTGQFVLHRHCVCGNDTDVMTAVS